VCLANNSLVDASGRPLAALWQRGKVKIAERPSETPSEVNSSVGVFLCSEELLAEAARLKYDAQKIILF
jgi:hypothetical protein